MSIETLAFENTLLRCGVESARVGLCILDQQETILLVTERFAAAVGKSPDELLGMQRRVLLTGGLKLYNFDRIFSVAAPELAAEGEMVDADGKHTSLLFEGRSFDYGDQSYRVTSVIEITDFGVTRDRLIGLRRQADALRSAVVVVDALQPDQPIVYVSPQFLELTGYRPSEVIGRNCRFLQGPASEQESLETIRTALKNRRSCFVVITNYRKDGSAFRNELTITPLTDSRGQISHFFAIQRALTSRDPLDSSLGH